MAARNQPKDALTVALDTALLTLGIVILIVIGAWLDTADEVELTQALAVEAARAQAQMAERERVRNELLPQVRRAYQQGLDDGAERERERVAQVREWTR
jgi:hypothetical protein